MGGAGPGQGAPSLRPPFAVFALRSLLQRLGNSPAGLAPVLGPGPRLRLRQGPSPSSPLGAWPWPWPWGGLGGAWLRATFSSWLDGARGAQHGNPGKCHPNDVEEMQTPWDGEPFPRLRQWGWAPQSCFLLLLGHLLIFWGQGRRCPLYYHLLIRALQSVGSLWRGSQGLFGVSLQKHWGGGLSVNLPLPQRGLNWAAGQSVSLR